MAINFPNSPTTGDLYTYENKTWKWNGYAWQLEALSTDYLLQTLDGGSPSSNYGGTTAIDGCDA